MRQKALVEADAGETRTSDLVAELSQFSSQLARGVEDATTTGARTGAVSSHRPIPRLPQPSPSHDPLYPSSLYGRCIVLGLHICTPVSFLAANDVSDAVYLWVHFLAGASPRVCVGGACRSGCRLRLRRDGDGAGRNRNRTLCERGGALF
jgi:hypothetical protein